MVFIPFTTCRPLRDRTAFSHQEHEEIHPKKDASPRSDQPHYEFETNPAVTIHSADAVSASKVLNGTVSQKFES